MCLSRVAVFRLMTRLEITSGPGAFFGLSLLIARCTCCMVIVGVEDITEGLLGLFGMSSKAACGGRGKKVCWKRSAFCWLDMAWPFKVGTNVLVGRLLRYLLTCQIVRVSASLTNLLHVVRLASLILFWYSRRSCFHLSTSCSLPYRFASRRVRCAFFLSWFRLSFHHRLLKGVGLFLGVDSSTALWMAVQVSLANTSRASVVSVVPSNGGRYLSSLTWSRVQSVLS